MARIISVEITASIDKLKEGLRGAGAQVRSTFEDIGKQVEVSKKRFETFGAGVETAARAATMAGMVLTAAVTVPIVGVGVGALKASAQIETLTTAFIPLLGSAQAAKTKMAELQTFANATPFALPEVAGASRMLQVLTKGALASGDALRTVGDVASATNQPFQDVAMWVGRLYDGLQSGAPVGEATMRLMEMGAMSGATKLRIEQLQKAGLDGNKIWEMASADFKQFAGGMALQADTMAGKWSTLQDSARTALGKIGDALAPVAKTAITLLTKMSDVVGVLAGWFSNMPGVVQAMVVGLAALAAAIGPVLLALGAVGSAVASITVAFPALAAVATPALAGIAAAALPIAAVAAALISVSVAYSRIANAVRENNELETLGARTEARTREILIKQREKWDAERKAKALAAEAELLAKNKDAEKEREKAANDAAKKVADFRKEREQEVIDYANAQEQRRANHEQELRNKLEETRRKDEARQDQEEQARRDKRNAERTLSYDRGLEQTRARLEAEDRLEDESAKRQTERANQVYSAMSPVLNSLSTSITNMILQTGTLRQMLLSVRDVLVGQLVSGVVTFFGKLAAQQIANAIFGKALAAAQTAALVPIAAAQASIWAAPATLSTIASVGTSAAAAPGQIAGSIALTKGLASFAVGTTSVPRDMLANIHEGEGIIPKTFMDGIKAGEITLGGSAGGGAPSARGTLVDLDSRVLDALRRYGRALVEITADQVANFAMGAT